MSLRKCVGDEGGGGTNMDYRGREERESGRKEGLVFLTLQGCTCIC